ncbi:MAG: methionyl-tRNA formyltransferase [Pseudomonadota bacterium]
MSFRVLFMGTPDFAVPALKAVHAAGHEILAVYTQPPRPAGRGKAERKSPVHVCAEALGLAVQTPKSLKNEEAQSRLRALGADLGIVVAYGLILPQTVLDMASHGFFNIHGSLLPRWRGAAPIQRAIEAGDTETGITIMQMEAGLDTGPMALKSAVPITSETTAQTLHDALAPLGAALMVEALEKLAEGSLVLEPQPEDGATYAAKIDKAEAALDFAALDAQAMQRKIHALSPFPGAFTWLGAKRLKLLQVTTTDQTGAPGKILDNQLTIACQAGAIRPVRVQLEGKAAMDVADFLRGQSIPVGDRLPCPASN